MASRFGRYAGLMAALGLVAICAGSASAAPATTRVSDRPASLVMSGHVAKVGSCARARAHLRQYADRGIKQVSCISVRSVKAEIIRPLVRIPDYCQVNAERYSRFRDCRYIQWTGEVINTQTGKVTGTINGAVVLWDKLYYNSRSWHEYIVLAIGKVSGTAVGGTINAPIACYVGVVPVPSTCQLDGKGSWAGQTGQLPAGQNDQYSGHLGFESITTATVEFVFNVDLTWTPPDTSPASEPIGPTEPIRCDSERIFRPTAGCVYVNYTESMFVVSKSDPTVTEAARFMARAQKAIPTHPGLYGAGAALNRTTDSKRIRRNRRVACKNVHPGPGQSCDEYPFASTDQGAALVPPGDFRADAVNAKQNSQVGTNLGKFFLLNRIADRDSFYVEITG
jgi:hypothetical protein